MLLQLMEYEYEEEMEDMYRQSLLKSFKKQLDNMYFSFIIVDSVFNKSRHVNDFWTYAKSKGFQVCAARYGFNMCWNSVEGTRICIYILSSLVMIKMMCMVESLSYLTSTGSYLNVQHGYNLTSYWPGNKNDQGIFRHEFNLLSSKWFVSWQLKHWGQDKMATIGQTTFSDVFSWMKIYEFRLIFHWS